MRIESRSRRFKEVDEGLLVHAWTPAGFVAAGLLTLEEDGEAISASFRYRPEYLATPGAFPIDPLNLPLGPTTWATQSQFVTLGGIFDAAPDAWGRKVVSAQLPEQSRQRVFRGAFLRGADGIGALVLTPQTLTTQLDLDRIVSMSLAERPGLSQLDRAAQAAADFESGLDLTQEMRDMLGGSWTIGGARPKSILRDDRPMAAAGASVIAKFDSRADQIARNRVEYASLRMARDMGFRVPDHELRELGAGRTALLLERFDRTMVSGQIHRRHYLSAMAMASYAPQSRLLDSRQDRATISWSKLLELSSRVCAEPAAARVEMFGRLALNTALQNTDDHLKNFGFLKRPGSPVQYEIAPVFDVSAQASARHYLHCLELGQIYSLDDILPLARRLGVAKAAADDIEQRIASVVAHSQDYLDAAGLPREQAQQAQAWIDAGCGPRLRQWRLAAQQGLSHVDDDVPTDDERAPVAPDRPA